jgi:hypothetical protein
MPPQAKTNVILTQEARARCNLGGRKMSGSTGAEVEREEYKEEYKEELRGTAGAGAYSFSI